MQRFENGSDICGFRSVNNSASKRLLDLLEPVKLAVWKVVIERVTVVKCKGHLVNAYELEAGMV